VIGRGDAVAIAAKVSSNDCGGAGRLTDATAEPTITFSPFVSSTMRVEPTWIDYNGHLNMAYYMVMFDRAVDQAFSQVGLGPDYLATRGHSYFTAETHTVYLRELPAHENIRVTVQLVDHDAKRIHAYLEIHQEAESWISATCEKLFLHVDMDTKKVVPFPDDILASLGEMQAKHGLLPRPKGLGRSIGLGAGRPPADNPLPL
jgi:acyl-CoA thioester hydrolase